MRLIQTCTPNGHPHTVTYTGCRTDTVNSPTINFSDDGHMAAGVQVWMSLIQTCTPNGHLYTVTYTRCRIDTINSPGDGHMAGRNM